MALSIKDIIRKLQKYEIEIRKSVHSQMHGNYHSIFKGAGIEFSDIRQYNYGDDIRSIDWKVSAKGHGTYIKLFQEDKEQDVFFLVDLSKSMEIGSIDKNKEQVIKEIAGVLMLSAVKEGSDIGLIGFTDQKEIYLPSSKGLKHAYQLIYKLFTTQVKSNKTDLNLALSYTLSVLKRKSIVILLSDFIDTGYEKNLQALSNKHDVVLIHVQDQRENNIPAMGIIPLKDAESGKTLWVNSSSDYFRKTMETRHKTIRDTIAKFSKANEANYTFIQTNEDYRKNLIQLFRVRNFHKKRVR
ncbi:MAG: DUF58 domain-containing protein [Cytophagaceae bacterium]